MILVICNFQQPQNKIISLFILSMKKLDLEF